MANEYMDELLENIKVRSLAEHLNELCEREEIVGFHYTRCEYDRIAEDGLICQSGAERREKFLLKHGPRLSPEARDYLVHAWISYFNAAAAAARDFKIHFCLNPHPPNSGVVRDLLYYFGGEAIYMPVAEHDEIGPYLHSIGNPLLVKCALSPKRLKTHRNLSWARVWLSSYHRTVNHSAATEDGQGYQKEAVPPSKIIEIERLENEV